MGDYYNSIFYKTEKMVLPRIVKWKEKREKAFLKRYDQMNEEKQRLYREALIGSIIKDYEPKKYPKLQVIYGGKHHEQK